MRKRLSICLATLSLFFLTVGIHASAAENQGATKSGTVQFTESQKENLSIIQKRIVADKKKLIEKYVEYGALSKEEADKMYNHLEKHYKMMEARDFQIPPHHHLRHIPK